MPLSFDNTQAQNFLGSPYAAPIGAGLKSKYPPNLWPFDIIWSQYGAGTKSQVVVNIPLQVGSSQLAPDIIQGVKIDNLGNPLPVFVYFPDTKDVLECASNDVQTYSVLTNYNAPQVICKGFAGTVLATTRVMFSNYPIPAQDSGGNLNYALGSNSIGATAYPLADLSDFISGLDLVAAGPATGVLMTGTAPINGTYFVNNLNVSLYNLAGTQVAPVVHIASIIGFISGTVYKRFRFQTPTVTAGTILVPVYELSGVNWRIPATEAISLSVTGGSGLTAALLQADIHFSYASNNGNPAFSF